MVDGVWSDYFQDLDQVQFENQTEASAGAATGTYLVVMIRGVKRKIALLAD